MGMRRLKRSAFAGWLAVIALSIQALIPALLAAEISVADTGSGGLFTLCAYGHLHVAPHHHEGSGSPHDSHEGDNDEGEGGALCPICVALLASPVFTAAPAVFLPLPASRPVAVVPAFEAAFTVASFHGSYRSRAPPFG
jgi:Protein of unknown function (DUF2946)